MRRWRVAFVLGWAGLPAAQACAYVRTPAVAGWSAVEQAIDRQGELRFRVFLAGPGIPARGVAIRHREDRARFDPVSCTLTTRVRRQRVGERGAVMVSSVDLSDAVSVKAMPVSRFIARMRHDDPRQVRVVPDVAVVSVMHGGSDRVDFFLFREGHAAMGFAGWLQDLADRCVAGLW